MDTKADTVTKVLFSLPSDVARELGEVVPPRQRSRFVSRLIQAELTRQRRIKASAIIDECRRTTPKLKKGEIVKLVSQDRSSH